MEATDLMLGDLVTFKDCQNDEAPTIVKIWQINANGDALVSIDGSDALDEISIDDEVVGIPLIPEILEKNGWYIPEDGLWYRHDVIGFLIALRTSGAYLYADEEHDRREFFCSIHFVHELQHALRLFGIDKEITL